MMKRRAARSIAGGLLVSALLLSGCATSLQSERLSASAFPKPVDLTHVPFFPQEEYQCGPAALATALQWAGKNATPEQLAPQVYLPSRQGSLQLELLASARRQGAIPYVINPRLDDLLAEVAAGNPVVVLQNLALSWYPKWHYAVVVGFDVAGGELVLRSGLEARHTVPIKLFERTWRRADYWAMVVMPPERIPRTAEETRYLQAIVALERLQQWGAASTAYRAASERWPRSFAAQLGAGNSRYALKDFAGAERAYRAALGLQADSGIALNNLAQALADQGRWSEAEVAAEQAIARQDAHRDTYQATLAEIRERRKRSERN